MSQHLQGNAPPSSPHLFCLLPFPPPRRLSVSLGPGLLLSPRIIAAVLALLLLMLLLIRTPQPTPAPAVLLSWADLAFTLQEEGHASIS